MTKARAFRAIGFYGGKDFPTLPLVWPDKTGLFPWDDNGTLDAAIQPVLGDPSVIPLH